jgi:negative regulator of flagellin synthesis FlgM
MDVKIEGTVKPVGSPLSGENRPKPQTTPSRQPGGAEPKVELSALSSSLGKAEAAIAAAPVVDRARVDEIRQAISEGRFQIDATRIADGLIDSVREMLVTRSGKA